MSWSSLKTFSIALSIVLLMLLRVAGDQAQALQKAELPNPDSFYKLVLLRDADSERGWAWSARDNAPQGFWMHWYVADAYSGNCLCYEYPTLWLRPACSTHSSYFYVGAIGMGATKLTWKAKLFT